MRDRIIDERQKLKGKRPRYGGRVRCNTLQVSCGYIDHVPQDAFHDVRVACDTFLTKRGIGPKRTRLDFHNDKP